MINTEQGKRLGKIYLPFHYNETKIGMIMRYLLIVPISMESKTYNWEITGTCKYFDTLNDMDSVPTYDLSIKWGQDYDGVTDIKLTRIDTGR